MINRLFCLYLLLSISLVNPDECCSPPIHQPCSNCKTNLSTYLIQSEFYYHLIYIHRPAALVFTYIEALKVTGQIHRQECLPLNPEQHLPGLGHSGFCPHGYFQALKHENFILIDSPIYGIQSTVTLSKLESFFIFDAFLLCSC